MKKKLLTIFALLVVMVALVVVSVMGTIAFMTASAAVSNTFTVGNVTISMYESKVDKYGVKVPGETGKTVDGNSYHLQPGATYTKDPTIYIEATSDEALLFVKVRNQIESIEETDTAKGKTIRTQLANWGWMLYGTVSTGDIYVFAGKLDDNGVNIDLSQDSANAALLNSIIARTAVPTAVGAAQQSINLFETFTVDEEKDLSAMAGAKVTLTAFAIQTTGFVEKDSNGIITKVNNTEAWKAIVSSFPYENAETVQDAIAVSQKSTNP